MRCLPILALTALIAAPLSAQQKPATAEQIVDAVTACRSITAPDWIEISNLASHGWKNAERRGNGRSRQIVRGVYEKQGNEAYLIVGKDELRGKICVVTARLADTSDYGPTAQAIAELIGMPDRADGFTYYWTIEGKQIRLDPAGGRNAPIARFEITANFQETAK